MHILSTYRGKGRNFPRRGSVKGVFHNGSSYTNTEKKRPVIYLHYLKSFNTKLLTVSICLPMSNRSRFLKNVTCSAILALLDKDDDLRARHELLNTERIL